MAINIADLIVAEEIPPSVRKTRLNDEYDDTIEALLPGGELEGMAVKIASGQKSTGKTQTIKSKYGHKGIVASSRRDENGTFDIWVTYEGE